MLEAPARCLVSRSYCQASVQTFADRGYSEPQGSPETLPGWCSRTGRRGRGAQPRSCL